MTYLLNLTDLLFTLHALRHGAYELNPVMRYVMTIPFAFPFFKIVVAGVLCWFLEYMAKCNRVARVGRNICAAFYGAVCAWHIVNISHVLKNKYKE